MKKFLLVLLVAGSSQLLVQTTTVQGLTLPGSCSTNFGSIVSGIGKGSGAPIAALIGKGLVSNGKALSEGSCSVFFSDSSTCTVTDIKNCEQNGKRIGGMPTNTLLAEGVSSY